MSTFTKRTIRAIFGSMTLAVLTACGGGSGGSSATTTTTTNTTPVANAGVDQSVTTGDAVTLSGTGSADSDGDALSYSWTLTSVPTGSSAALTGATGTSPSFTADVAGDYLVSLTVNDGVATSGADTTLITAATAQSTVADLHTPAPIGDALKLTRSVTWTALSGVPANLTRFSMGEANTSDLFVLIDDSFSVNASLAMEIGLAAETLVTDDRLLRSMFKFIELDDGTFRIVPTKHSNYALDVGDPGVTDALIMRDIRSGELDTANAGFLAFEVTSATPMTLSAVGRRVYNATSGAYEDDPAWVAKDVIVVNGELVLTVGTGSSIALYSPPIDFDIPFDFNPDQIERVSNAEVTPLVTLDDPISRTADQIVATYADQLTVAGADADTTAAAEAMIAAIETSLAAEGAQLRYAAEFYLTFRAGLFARVLQSSDSTDGVLGQLTVPYVFFTNEADEDGVHHPFMVIASYNLPDSLTLLWDVSKPPGDGLSAEYADQAVTRSIHREAFLMKIPMRDYGEVSSLTENEMVTDLASEDGVTLFDHHNRASISATGVAIDGVVIYPTFNNSLHVAQIDAELSAHGMHSGQGLGAHYHADAHSATRAGLNLYNDSDYEGHTHPPIVSIGFDGVAGYGIYQDGDTSSDGASVALDDFGGHEHDGYGYHYHSFTAVETTPLGAGPGDPAGGVEYTAHQLPPFGAWGGRINDIPEFWQGTVPNYVGGRSVYLGTE